MARLPRLAYLLVLLCSAHLHGATSISQNGITWTFDRDYATGKYCNGDSYVVAPAGLKIIAISPASTWTQTKSATVTISRGAPCSVSWVGHGLSRGQGVVFSTTGTLPEPLVPGHMYYIVKASTDSFTISAQYGRSNSGYNAAGVEVITTTLGTGTHSAAIGRVKNGSMLNPESRGGGIASMVQGFDSAMFAEKDYPIANERCYDAVLNAARPNNRDLSSSNPLIVAADSSLVSSVSFDVPSVISGIRPQIYDAAILTIVSSAPREGAFRPPPYGSDKSGDWNKFDLDYSILRSLQPVPGTPPLATVEGYFTRPWLHWHTGSFSQHTSGAVGSPSGNSGMYGREVSWRVADGVLSLHLNYPNSQKEKLLISLVQLGIDIYGAVARSSGVFNALDGINNGRKLPVLLAGLALHDERILEYTDTEKHMVFSEDLHCFQVEQSDVGRPLYTSDGRKREVYLTDDVGIAEWGGQHDTDISRDGRNWDLAYRDIVGSSFVGTCIAARLLSGGTEKWNNPIWFRYVRRYLRAPIQGANPVQTFHLTMWNTYVDTTPPDPPIAAGLQ